MSTNWKPGVAARQKRANDIEAIKKRFMKYVELAENGCWIWIGARQGASGYGQFWLYGKREQAHRASYIIFKGPIPDGLDILHGCDDRACVAPECIRAGTPKENISDAAKRGRLAIGSRNGMATLTEKQIGEMRAEYVEGRRGEWTRLANKYCVTVANVGYIVTGKTWKHVPPAWGTVPLKLGPIETGYVKGSKMKNSKVTEAQVVEMREAWGKDVSITAIAEWYGLKKPQTWAICTGRAWKHVVTP